MVLADGWLLLFCAENTATMSTVSPGRSMPPTMFAPCANVPGSLASFTPNPRLRLTVLLVTVLR